jgi:prophage tail gpP-like protein
MSDNILLRIAGTDFGGWKRATVSKSMDVMAGTFQVEVTSESRIETDFGTTYPITMGDQVEVLVDDKLVLKGFVEDINNAYSKNNHSIAIAGRDVTCDLVDCVHYKAGDNDSTGNEWESQTVEQIIKAMVGKFDGENTGNVQLEIDDTVSSKVSTEIEIFRADEGATVMDVIMKLAVMFGFRPVTYGDGKLTLTQTAQLWSTDALQRGVNVLEGSLLQSNRERYSIYIAKGTGYGNDDKTVADIAHPSDTYEDDVIRRYRPLVLLSEMEADEGTCGNRAQWEAALRAGRSREYECKVQGWTQSNGDLWQINNLVMVRDETFNLDSDLLIYAVDHSFDTMTGRTTALKLCSPDKYKLQADLEKATTTFDEQ